MRSRENHHLPILRRLVNIALLAPTNLRQRRGENAAVHGVRLRVIGHGDGFRMAQAHRFRELPMNVPPLLHAGEREEFAFAEFPQRIASLPGTGFMGELPNF